MAAVSSCPKTEAEFFKASERIGCGNDINGHNQYICIPNQEKTSLVELCYNEIMGVREKGNCLEATVGKVIERTCENFVSGCPNATFFDYGFYKYPACQNINTKDNCYVMDPSCPSVLPDDIRCTNSDDAIVYACSILGGVIVLLIAVLIIIIIRWKKKKCPCFSGSPKNKDPPEVKPTTGNGGEGVKPTTGNGGEGVKPTTGNGGEGVKPTTGNGGEGVKPTTGNGGEGVKPTTGNGGEGGLPKNKDPPEVLPPTGNGGEGDLKEQEKQALVP